MAYSAYSQAELDLMYQAYYGGRIEITHDNKKVKFDSLSALWKAIQRYEVGLAGSSAPPRYVRLRGGKGL